MSQKRFIYNKKNEKQILLNTNKAILTKFEFKRSFLFLKEHLQVFKRLNRFLKHFKLSIFQNLNSYSLLSKKRRNNQTAFIFISEPGDFFMKGFFTIFSQQFFLKAFHIEWTLPGYLFFLKKTSFTLCKHFSVYFISQNLFLDIDFQKIFKTLDLSPVFFFSDFKGTKERGDLKKYMNVFPIFLTNKKNYSEMVVFFKLLKKLIF